MSNSALEFIYLNPPVGCLNRPARAEIWWSTGCLGAFFWVDPTHYSWSVPPTALLVPVVSGCFQIANMTDWKMMKRCKANVNEHEVVKRWNIKIHIYNILYHPERIDGATAPPLPSEKKKNTAALKLFATEVGEWPSTLNTNLKVEPQLQLNQFLLALLCWGVSNKACQQDVPLELGVLC